MIALNSTRSLEIILGGAVTTNQLPFTATYADHDPSVPSFTSTPADGQTNNTTAVTVVPAPSGSIQRTIKRVNVYNADTAQATVTLRINNGGTLRIQTVVILQAGERLEYEDGEGFSVYNTLGAQKVTAANTSPLDKGFITGFLMSWNSTTSITISSGAAHLQGSDSILASSSSITLSSLSLSANTLYHVYFYSNAGAPAFEVSSTAPSSVYYGTARSKTGDTSRRYIGSIRAGASGAIFNFDHGEGGLMTYKVNINTSPLFVVSGQTQTAVTAVSLSAAVPVSSRRANLYMENSDTGSLVYFSSGELTPNSDTQTFLLPQSELSTAVTLSSAQAFAYQYNSAPGVGSLNVWMIGYIFER